MKDYLKLVFVFVVIFLFFQCKQEYIPKVEESDTRLLVVEGFINSGQGYTVIHLSRAVGLNDSTASPEYGAQVNVEGDNGSSFSLSDNGNGQYSTPQLILDNNAKYRVHIKTSSGKEYLSDYSPVKHTPVIDSVTWQRENEGVQIYVSTHDDLNSTKYYRWAYSETWEFHSPYLSFLDYSRDPVTNVPIDVGQRPNADTTIYKCWRTQNSTSIILGSSEKLTSDQIYLPVRYIEPYNEELSVLYYFELTQYALSQDAYLFYQRLKKNTEQIGTLFDPQPSQLGGNIHCTTNPEELVIGFLEVSEEQKAHIFISNDDVRPWVTPIGCTEIILKNELETLQSQGQYLIPLRALTFRGLQIVTFTAAEPICVDCTMRGTNIKPAFWP